MRLRWRILDALNEPERAAWIGAWAGSPMQLPFAHPGYCEAVTPDGGRLLAALLEGTGGTVLYPFILREVADGPTGTHDLVSPYGYGGPLCWDVSDLAGLAGEFWTAFDAWACTQGVVSEFIRLSLFDDVLPYPGVTRPRTVNYVSPVAQDAEQLWTGLAPKVRQNARKAVRSGVTTVLDESGEMLDEFIRIYTATMVRRASDEWYRFDRAFFEHLQRELPGRMVGVYALAQGRPVSADLMLLGGTAGYYFLGGTDADAFGTRPNELVKTECLEWLRQHGYQHYVLGGGMSPGDGLERYKRGFAPAGARTFCTGERILDPLMYEQLVASAQQRFRTGGADWDTASEFFPAYRRAVPAAAASEPRAVAT